MCCRRGKAEEEEEGEDDFVLPEGVEPFLSAAPLYTGVKYEWESLMGALWQHISRITYYQHIYNCC
jgi:hypothetical protein